MSLKIYEKSIDRDQRENREKREEARNDSEEILIFLGDSTRNSLGFSMKAFIDSNDIFMNDFKNIRNEVIAFFDDFIEMKLIYNKVKKQEKTRKGKDDVYHDTNSIIGTVLAMDTINNFNKNIRKSNKLGKELSRKSNNIEKKFKSLFFNVIKIHEYIRTIISIGVVNYNTKYKSITEFVEKEQKESPISLILNNEAIFKDHINMTNFKIIQSFRHFVVHSPGFDGMLSQVKISVISSLKNKLEQSINECIKFSNDKLIQVKNK